MTDEPYEYDVARLANFGRDASRSYTALLRVQDRLCQEINDAIASGIKPIKITHDVLGRCATREAQVDLMSLLIGSAKMGKIPMAIADPFEKGVRARRV